MQKDLSPRNLGELFSLIAKSLGGWWISGIILTIIFALFFKVWTNTNLIPFLFVLGVVTRIYQVNYPIHGMLEIVTFSAILIAFRYNPFIAAVFAVSAFVVSRFFGHTEGPEMAFIFGFATAIAAYLVPIFSSSYTLVNLILLISAIRTFIVTLINFAIHRQPSILVIQTIWGLIVGVGLNYGLVLFLMSVGWI